LKGILIILVDRHLRQLKCNAVLVQNPDVAVYLL
jgi:hypothetical protein